MAEALRETYFKCQLVAFHRKAAQTGKVLEEEWVTNRSISVYVALIGTEYPHKQPGLIKQFVELISETHRNATLDIAPLVIVVDAFLQMLNQLDATYLGDELSARTDKERETAMRIKDGMRENDVKWIVDVIGSILSGTMFKTPDPSFDWWIKLCRKAVGAITHLSVWVDLGFLRDQRFHNFYKASLEGSLPSECGTASVEAIQALVYKRMHAMAKIYLINDFGVVDLITKATLRPHSVALGQAINVIGLQLIDSFTFAAKDPELAFNQEEAQQFTAAGVPALPSKVDLPKYLEICWTNIIQMLYPALTVFLSANLQAAERVGPFLKECFRIFKSVSNSAANKFKISECIEKMFKCCYERIKLPGSCSIQELESYSSFELDEDDGSAISEFFVCRKLSLSIFFKAFGAGLQSNPAICRGFLAYLIGLQEFEATWNVQEASLRLLEEMIDAWRDVGAVHMEENFLPHLISALVQIGSKLVDSKGQQFVLITFLECLGRLLSIGKFAKEPDFPHEPLHRLVSEVVLPCILNDQKNTSKRLLGAAIRCLCKSSGKKPATVALPAIGVVRALLGTKILRIMPILDDPRLTSPDVDDDLTASSRSELYDHGVVSTDDQQRLYEYLGELIPQTPAELRHELVKCALAVNATDESLPYGPQIELGSRQAKCLGYLLKTETDTALLREIRAYLVSLIRKHLSSWKILSSSLMLLRRVLLVLDGDLEDNLKIYQLILESIYQVTQGCKGERLFEMNDAIGKVCSVLSTTPNALARIILANPSTGCPQVEQLVSTLLSLWQNLNRSGGNTDCLYQIANIYLSLISGARNQCTSSAPVCGQAAYVLAFQEVQSGLTTFPLGGIMSLIGFVEFAPKEYQFETVMRAYMDFIQILTRPGLNPPEVLTDKFNPALLIRKLQTLSFNKHRLAENVAAIIKFVIDTTEPRDIPRAWQESIVGNFDTKLLQVSSRMSTNFLQAIANAQTKSQLREAVLTTWS